MKIQFILFAAKFGFCSLCAATAAEETRSKLRFRLALFFLLATISAVLPAQTPMDWWYFGGGVGLHFTPTKVKSLGDGRMSAIGNTISMSDSLGNLLFYSNGDTIWNRNHKVMPHGKGFLDKCSSSPLGFALPYPKHPHQYLLFILASRPDYHDKAGLTCGYYGFDYSIVDMNMEGGLGDVSDLKNIPLKKDAAKGIIALWNADKSGYWVIVQEFPGDSYYAYAVTENGISKNPVISKTGQKRELLSYSKYEEAFTSIFAAPNSSQIIVNSSTIKEGRYWRGIELLDFDNATGKVSSKLFIDDVIPCYAVSPNGKYLYAYGDDDKMLYQFEANVSTKEAFLASKIAVGNKKAYGWMQLAPNGKIYMANMGYSDLSVIEKPDEKGLACSYKKDIIKLRNSYFAGLPEFPPAVMAFFPPAPTLSDVFLCENSPLVLQGIHIKDGVSYLWKNDKGFVSTQFSDTISNGTKEGKYSFSVFDKEKELIYSDTLEVLAITEKVDTVKAGFCFGLSYTLPNGKIVSQSGNYEVETKTDKGCSRKTIYQLSYKTKGYITHLENVLLLQGASYKLANGQIVKESGFHNITIPTKNGCDSMIITQIETLQLDNIHFGKDQYSLTNEAQLMLQQWANFLQQYPKTKLCLYAHTDTDASENYNQLLSEYRAMAAIKYISQFGIAVERLTWVGLGETNPLIPEEKNAVEKALNRRISFKIEDIELEKAVKMVLPYE